MIDSNICPECGQRLRNEGGCVTCLNPVCAWSACS